MIIPASERADLPGPRALAAWPRGVLNPLVLLETAGIFRPQGGAVNEHVGCAVAGAMKPQPLSALNHFTMP